MVKLSVNKIMGMVACYLLVFCLSGCWSAREINDLEVVVGMGIDESDVPDNVLLTAQIVKPGEMRSSSPEQGAGSGKAYWNARSLGESIFDAAREMTHLTGNRLFASHSQVLIFSEKIAAGGIDEYIDFFLRSREVRPSTIIFVSENEATEVLDIKPDKEKLPAMNISKLITASEFTAQTKKVNLQEFSSKMMSKTLAPMAPLITSYEVNGEKKSIVSGMAVFKKYSMVGTLDQYETRGYLFAQGEVKSAIIHVTTPGGKGRATLEVNKAESKVTPELNGKKIIMNISVKSESSVTEQSTPENLATEPAFEMMQNEQAKVIKQDIIKAFEKSKKLGCDIFGFGELIHKKYRSQWKEIEGKWDEIYPSIELVIEVEAKIRKTELITKPVFSEEG